MIEISGLSKQYGKKHVITGINLCMEKENYGLVGPNGAGKTTFIRMLAGVIKPTSGSILYKRGSVGYLSQKFGCIPELTVYEQLEYFACLKKLSYNEQTGDINRVLNLVHLEDKKKEKCKSLSGGMVRRVGIAQALLGKPELLLLDEPTVGLDPDERKTFANIIKHLRGDMTVVLSTHIINDIANTCDKMIIMEKGVIIRMIDMKDFGEENPDDIYFRIVHSSTEG